jgi:hypothetical protein
MYRSTYSWSRHWLGRVVSFTRRPLYPREKGHRYPLDKKLGGPHNGSGRREELEFTGTQTPTPRTSSPSQSLYRLRYPGSFVLLVSDWNLNIWWNGMLTCEINNSWTIFSTHRLLLFITKVKFEDMKSMSDYQHWLLVLMMKLNFKFNVSSVRVSATCTKQLLRNL